MADLPHANRLRTGCYSQTGQIYLLTAATCSRSPFFADWRTGRLVVDQFRQAQTEELGDSLAWVVMPDHFHWLVELKNSSLPALVLATKSRSARAVNARLERKRMVWQRGFHDRAIRREEDLQAVVRYIVANPLRAGACHTLARLPVMGCQMAIAEVIAGGCYVAIAS